MGCKEKKNPQLSSLEIIGPCKVITLLGDLCHVKSTPVLAHHIKAMTARNSFWNKGAPQSLHWTIHVHIGGLKCYISSLEQLFVKILKNNTIILPL